MSIVPESDEQLRERLCALPQVNWYYAEDIGHAAGAELDHIADVLKTKRLPLTFVQDMKIRHLKTGTKGIVEQVNPSDVLIRWDHGATWTYEKSEFLTHVEVME